MSLVLLWYIVFTYVPGCFVLYHMCTVTVEAREDILGLELQVVVSCHVGAETQTSAFVLCCFFNVCFDFMCVCAPLACLVSSSNPLKLVLYMVVSRLSVSPALT